MLTIITDGIEHALTLSLGLRRLLRCDAGGISVSKAVSIAREAVAEKGYPWIGDPIIYEDVLTMEVCSNAHMKSVSATVRLHRQTGEVLDFAFNWR